MPNHFLTGVQSALSDLLRIWRWGCGPNRDSSTSTVDLADALRYGMEAAGAHPTRSEMEQIIAEVARLNAAGTEGRWLNGFAIVSAAEFAKAGRVAIHHLALEQPADAADLGPTWPGDLMPWPEAGERTLMEVERRLAGRGDGAAIKPKKKRGRKAPDEDTVRAERKLRDRIDVMLGHHGTYERVAEQMNNTALTKQEQRLMRDGTASAEWLQRLKDRVDQRDRREARKASSRK